MMLLSAVTFFAPFVMSRPGALLYGSLVGLKSLSWSLLRQTVMPVVEPLYELPLAGPDTLMPCMPLLQASLSHTVLLLLPSSILMSWNVLYDSLLREIVLPL